MPDLRARYIDLLKKSLINELYIELEAQLVYAVLCGSHDEAPDLQQLTDARRNTELLAHLHRLKQEGDTLVLKGLDDQGQSNPNASLRNHSEFAHTMVGRRRLDNIQYCVEQALREGVAGDLLQAGCWRGGAALFMRGVLAANDCTDRIVWVADSFQGLPQARSPEDRDFAMDASILPVLSVGLDEVKELFERYNLLDRQVDFLEGWFAESLKRRPAGPLAVLHIDADLYESTRDVLVHCYERVSPGGFVIIDDYGILPPCREAVDEFAYSRGLDLDLHSVGDHAAYWRVNSSRTGNKN